MNALRAAFVIVGFCTTSLAVEPGGFLGAGGDGKDKESPAKKNKRNFTIGKETTFVTGPVDQEGYIDYPAALNQLFAKGVTAENNANVLIWQAIGPQPAGKSMPPGFFKAMGMEGPPEKGDYFVDYLKFVKIRFKFAPGDQTADDQFFQASRRSWKEKEFPYVAAWLKANEKALGLVTEATKRPRYFSPMIPPKSEKGSRSLLETLLPGVQKTRDLAKALACRAMLNLGEGRFEQSWQDLFACHRLGHLVGTGPSLVDALVGVAIDSIASQGDLIYVEQAADAKRILQCLGDLQALPPLPDVARKVDLCERFVMLETVLMVDRHGVGFLSNIGGDKPKESYFFTDLLLADTNWDPALKNVGRWYDRVVKALGEQDRSLRAQEFRRLDNDLRAKKRDLNVADELAKAIREGKEVPETKGWLIGDILVTLMMPAANRVQDAVDRAEQIRRNGQIAFALGACWRDRGRYPKTLDELVPKYLAKVPNDYFANKPPIYRPDDKGYLLYSVGVNGKDDGGRWLDDVPSGDDPSVRMPIPAPKNTRR